MIELYKSKLVLIKGIKKKGIGFQKNFQEYIYRQSKHSNIFQNCTDLLRF